MIYILLQRLFMKKLIHLFNLSISLTTLPGLCYTPLIGTNIIDDISIPVFGEYNSSRYNNYSSLDISINHYFQFKHLGIVAYLTVNNLLNRKNIQNYYYDYKYENPITKFYQQRCIYFGFVYTIL